MANNLDKQYQSLLQDILDNGVEKKDRTGTGTISVFGRQIRHKMSDGFPLLTTKKMAFKTMVTELLWFLRGDTNIKYLVDNGCHIWDGDAYKNYAAKTSLDWDGQYTMDEFINKIKTDHEFAKQWGELGPIYGAQWRKWDGIDQIQELINTLKTNPDSRRMLVSAWNVNYLDEMTLPPCHYSWQCYVREGKYLSLMWNQRSVDTGLGLGFNIASYGLLLEMIAKQVNMIPDELIGNLGDVHLYLDHVEPIKEQLNREPFNLPTLKIHGKVDDIAHYKINDFELIGYQFHPTIKLPLSN